MTTPTTPWACNTTPAQVAEALRSKRRVVCLTHAKPDGDAAGSSLAIARTLIRCGVDASVCYVSPIPAWLVEIAGSTPYTSAPPGSPSSPLPASAGPPDAVVVTDTGSWTQLSEFAAWLKPLRDRTVLVDHHLHGDGDVADTRLICVKDAATTQAIAPVCCELLGCSASKLPKEIAEALYLGLATDTQWFRLSNVSPPTLRLAADLIEAGVNHTRLYELIEQQDRASRWKLLGRALSTLEFHHNGRVALMTLRLKDFADCGADRNDTSGFADMVQHIASVQVAVVLTEAEVNPGEAPTTKVSMRSKPGPSAVDVNKITKMLGGGGHALAAGAKMMGSTIDDARARVLSLLS